MMSRELQPVAPDPDTLSNRQREALHYVRVYREAAHEFPSAAWLARRLHVSRQRAAEHIRILRDRKWLDASR
jgi:hypothetical protein